MSLSPELLQAALASPLLFGLAPENQAGVLARSELLDLGPSEQLFAQGEKPGGLYLLLSGRVRTWTLDPQGRAVALKVLAAGELVGCIAAFARSPQPASAETVTSACVLYWPDDVLRELLRLHPSLAENALRLLGERTLALMNRLVTVSTVSASGRIAAALLDLSGGEARRLTISRQELADLTATTMHTVSRTVSAWHRRRLILGGRTRIEVLDVEGLSKEAAGASLMPQLATVS